MAVFGVGLYWVDNAAGVISSDTAIDVESPLAAMTAIMCKQWKYRNYRTDTVKKSFRYSSMERFISIAKSDSYFLFQKASIHSS